MNKFKETLKKMWSKITESKLNISMFIAGVIAFILLVVILVVIISRDGEVNNELFVTGDTKDTNTTKSTEETTEQETETTTKEEEQYSTKIDENATTNIVNRASRLSAKVSVKNSWTNDGEYFVQYNLEVTNVSDDDIDGWAAVLDMTKSYTLVDSWNFTFKEGNKKLIINPFNDSRKIPSGETVSGGFIVKGKSNVYIDYITMYVGDKIETVKNGNTYIPPATEAKTERNDDTTTYRNNNNDTTTAVEPASNDETTTLPPDVGNNENESDTTTDEPGDDTTTPATPPTQEIVPPGTTTPIPTETTIPPEINTTTKADIVLPNNPNEQ